MRTSPDFVPFFSPCLGKEEEEAVLRVMRSGWITTGKESLEFEKEFSTYVSCNGSLVHSLAVNSASSGLQLAYEACGIGTGDFPGKILTTPYTFASTVLSACHLGGGVVYADIEKDSFNIDPVLLERALDKGKDIKAIVPVHIAGLPCDMDSICKIARKHGVPVVEDAAHAFPSKTKNGFAGTLGDIGVFSFYATKPITTGEGGMVCTCNDEYKQRMAIMRMHGIDRPVWNRYTSDKASWEYDVVAPGYKFNLPDILAAIGRVQLKKAEAMFDERKKIAEQYNEAFAGCDFLRLPPDGDGNAWHLYILGIVPHKLRLTRNEFAAKLQEKGLKISMHFIPHFNMTYFKNRFGLNPSDYPNAMNRYETSFSLPLWPGMTEQMVCHVVETVTNLGKEYYVR